MQGTHSTYPKVAVQWLHQALCFYQSICLVDSEVLLNRHLRVAANRYAYIMKYILYILTFGLLNGCILHYDSLEYYHEGYNPNNDSFPTKGFYFAQSDSSFLKKWPNAIKEMYFFKDGTFNWGSNVENIDSLDNWICKYGERQFRYGPFGFYTLKNDTIYVEYIVTDPMGNMKAERYEFKAIQTDVGINIIELNDKRYSENWIFHGNACVPDSVNNWIKRHRKYKI